MEKFLGLVCGLDINLGNFLSQTERVLRQLSAFRLANERMNLGLKRVTFERDLELLRDYDIVFDHESFVNRYLQQDSKLRHRDSFINVPEEIAAILPGERHRAAHGHDFVSLLGWFAPKAVREVRQDDEVKRWLYAMADPSIAEEVPFAVS